MKDLDRRQWLQGASLLGGGLATGALSPGWALGAAPGMTPGAPVLHGPNIDLTISHGHLTVDGRMGHAVAINGSAPGPLLRLRQGQTARLSVTNALAEDTSVHWHGLLVPFQFDGVPGLTFPGIRPGETFVYEFPVIQSGTYWYHSHSGMQEQEGLYGPIVIDPPGDDPVQYDREHVIVLSDYSFMHPHMIFKRMKQQPGLFNFQKQTVASWLAGKDQSLRKRVQWGQMRMDPTDISDVTGAVLMFLINGQDPADNWTGLFRPGERLRLRFINSAAQTEFNIRIPGLKLTVVAADGQLIRPVEVDEFQIANAETFDVIVRPTADEAYTLVAEAVDRSGMARGTLAPRPGMTAVVPPLRARPLDTMRDMGMEMEGMAMGSMAMGGMDMSMRSAANAPGLKLTPGVQTIAPMPQDRTGEPGQGLEDTGHRVLVYTDLIALEPNPDTRPPTRAMTIRLTGNMERFMWGFDGEKFSETTKPYSFAKDERVRINLVNDTMMSHPIHLHGHFFELVHGPEGFRPRKHTVNVPPAGKVSFDFTAKPGDWAFHCHMLYHMHGGMFQVFSVRPIEGAAA